jgi:PAS domain S-box-containing protein
MPFTSKVVSRPIVGWTLYLRTHPWAAYAVAVSAVALATVLRWLIGPVGVPFLTYFPTVTIVGLLGGVGPGSLAALLSAGLAVSFYSPAYEWDDAHTILIGPLLFLVACWLKLFVIALLHQALDELIEQERNIRQLVEAAPAGIVVVAEDGSIVLMNEAAQSLFGYEPHELIGRSVEDLVPENLRTSHLGHRRRFIARPQARAMGKGLDLSCQRKDGTSFEAEIGLSPLTRGTRTSVVATVVDISERRRSLERERFLMRELHHRSQNMFAIVQAITRRTLEGHPDRAEAQQLLLSRFHALAEAQRVLLDNVWQGADLRKIIEAGVGAFTLKVEVKGCDLVVNRDAAQQLALIFHELTTNSLKHGALSSLEGKVKIDGRVDREKRTFELRWREEGGPPVVEPTRQGFGSAILLQAAKQLAEDVAIDYHPQGLRYVLRIALNSLEQSDQPVASISDAVTSVA